MLIKTIKSKLEKGLEKVSRLTTKKISLPILNFCLLETEKNFLKLTSTNLETGIIFWILTKVEKEGKVCVDPRFLLNVLNQIPDETITITLENKTLKIDTKNTELKIQGQNPEDFPLIPTKDSFEKVSFEAKKLCNALTELVNIPSPSMGKPEISGVFFAFEKDVLRMAATDSFRLAEKKLRIEKPTSKNYALVLPQEATKEIISIFGDKEGSIDFYISPNQIFIESQMAETEHPEILFTSRLVEGEYPNYQEIIPKKFKTKIKTQKETIQNHIKLASLFSGRINDIKLKIEPKEKTIEITSQNTELGEYKSQIKGEVEGEKMEISFNYRFLLQGIQSVQEKEINLFFSSEEGPAIIKGEKNEDYFYILMPIKIS